MFIGYGIPATLVGFFVITSNFNILRSKLHPTLKWVVIYFTSLAAYVVFALIVRSLAVRH